jgi:hypothetical protein
MYKKYNVVVFLLQVLTCFSLSDTDLENIFWRNTWCGVFCFDRVDDLRQENDPRELRFSLQLNYCLTQ